MKPDNDILRDIAGWTKGNPVQDGLKRLAQLKFGEGVNVHKFDNNHTTDSTANKLIDSLNGAITYSNTHNGKLKSDHPRLFLRVLKINALYNYITKGEIEDNFLSKLEAVDKFYWHGFSPKLLTYNTSTH
jgi:hypothetical protein